MSDATRSSEAVPKLMLQADALCIPLKVERESSAGLKRPQMQYQAIRWSKQAAQRYEWAARDLDRKESRDAARKLLNDLGVSDETLRQLMHKTLIQVSIPWGEKGQTSDSWQTAESDNWEERIMPWELLLMQGMRSLDENVQVPCVVRRLCVQNANEDSNAARKPPTKAILVTNCRRRDNDAVIASFEHERSVLETRLPHIAIERINDVTRKLIEDSVKFPAKDAFLHFIAEQRQLTENGSKGVSQVWLPQAEGQEDWADYSIAAKSLGEARPRLLALSFDYSGPRLAALAVAHGAQAAIGFQDSVSEELRVNFFARFYEEMAQTGGLGLAQAFQVALKDVNPLLRGTGIILWSRSDLVPPLASYGRGILTPRRGAKQLTKSAKAGKPDEMAPAPPPAASPPAEAAPRSDEAISAIRAALWLGSQPEIRTKSRLNYAMMHNQPSWDQVYPYPDPSGPLFDAFTLRRPAELARRSGNDTPMALVRVTLQSGDVSSAWTRLVPLNRDSTPLARDIRVPLTSALARTLRESIHTLVDMEISVDGVPVFHECRSVTLQAVDEWQDDGVATFWLPSFVQPRDPAISALVRDARHILGALADDYHAAFDGYQSDDPARVDLQAQALWAAVMQHWSVAYINPPPSFTTQSQRLRRPGDVLAERAGTCIDLALLFAAALEYVDIEPLLVLAPGHAYVAYCRKPREEGRELFTKNNVTANAAEPEAGEAVLSEAAALGSSAMASASGERSLPPWAYDQRQHRQIVKALKEGDIAALEATYLTRLMPFSAALAEGASKLGRRIDFDCLLDVRRARQCHVTPLPLIYDAVK